MSGGIPIACQRGTIPRSKQLWRWRENIRIMKKKKEKKRRKRIEKEKKEKEEKRREE